MAKNKKTASGSMVLVGKGSYTAGKEKSIRKGSAISQEQYEALPEVDKTYFTDPKTAAKLLKRPVVEVVKTEEDSAPGTEE